MKYRLPLIVLLLFAAYAIASAQPMPYLITGTYTSGKSEGIYVYQFDTHDGGSIPVSHVNISNPSYLAVSPDEKFVYSVEEDAKDNGKGGMITAFSFNKKTGMLTYINRQASGGDHPCYITTDKTGKWVIAGNYTSGSLSVLPVLPNRGLGAATTIIQHQGSGPNTARQLSPHVHCTLFSADNRFLFVPDLGIDKVMIYAFDELTGKLTPAQQPFFAANAGAGPRHLCFHPSNKYAYLVEELSGTIVAFNYNNGELTAIQSISSMPAGDTSYAGSADIHVSPDGRFLYASNRGEANSIAIYSINAADGKLSLIGHQPTLGQTPRNFNFDPTGNFLLVGNQNSDEIVIFKRDHATGLLTDTHNRIELGKPVCLKWIQGE